MNLSQSNPYAKFYTNQRQRLSSPADAKKKYVVIFFRSENKYCVEKARRTPAPDENGMVIIEGVKGTIIREGSKECCLAAARALEEAINTDNEIMNDFPIEKAKRMVKTTATVLEQESSTDTTTVATTTSFVLPKNVPVPQQKQTDICSQSILIDERLNSSAIVMNSSNNNDPWAIDEEVELTQSNDPKERLHDSPSKKKRKSTTSSNQPRKRLQATTNNFDDVNNDDSSLSADLSLLNYFKKIENRNNHQLKRIILGQEKLEKSMKHLFDNQKKIQKAFCAHQLFVPFKDPLAIDQDDTTDDETNNGFQITMMWPNNADNEEVQPIDILKIPGNRSNINAYILKLVSIVFGREGLENIETKQVSTSNGYLFIKEATRHKFKIPREEFDLFWPCAHEVIMQKRRNLHKALKLKTNHDLELTSNTE